MGPFSVLTLAHSFFGMCLSKTFALLLCSVSAFQYFVVIRIKNKLSFLTEPCLNHYYPRMIVCMFKSVPSEKQHSSLHICGEDRFYSLVQPNQKIFRQENKSNKPQVGWLVLRIAIIYNLKCEIFNKKIWDVQRYKKLWSMHTKPGNTKCLCESPYVRYVRKKPQNSHCKLFKGLKQIILKD